MCARVYTYAKTSSSSLSILGTNHPTFTWQAKRVEDGLCRLFLSLVFISLMLYTNLDDDHCIPGEEGGRTFSTLRPGLEGQWGSACGRFIPRTHRITRIGHDVLVENMAGLCWITRRYSQLYSTYRQGIILFSTVPGVLNFDRRGRRMSAHFSKSRFISGCLTEHT